MCISYRRAETLVEMDEGYTYLQTQATEQSAGVKKQKTSNQTPWSSVAIVQAANLSTNLNKMFRNVV